MNNGLDGVDHGERLSALIDGELDSDQVAAACGDWREDAGARRRWHDYQLIGDVLRSDDLASSRAHDEAFLVALRSRLVHEPVVFAPALDRSGVEDAPRRRGGRAVAVGAIAAGFLVVIAGALTFTGLPTAQMPESVLAQSDSAVRGVAPVEAASLEATAASGELIRDAHLDRYLAAHQQWTGSAKLGGHATYLRPPSDAAPVR